MSTSPLSIDVYVASMRPYTCPDQLGVRSPPGRRPAARWSPVRPRGSSSTPCWPSRSHWPTR